MLLHMNHHIFIKILWTIFALLDSEFATQEDRTRFIFGGHKLEEHVEISKIKIHKEKLVTIVL